jgi:catechol 2,3-dioxygenase-like lactoylglutathione lyase family enzyme
VKRIFGALTGLILCVSAAAQDGPARPRILGTASVHFYSSDLKEARSFYSKVLHPEGACLWCEETPLQGVNLGTQQLPVLPLVMSPSSGQQVMVSKPLKTPPPDLLYEIVFATDNVQAMKKYLLANKIPIEKGKRTPDNYCTVIDPEGHRIAFTQPTQSMSAALSGSADMRIIHAGFVVHDRAVEDRFYKDILGFHIYWHGGRKDDETSWVDMQVPDGTDWVEYMLNVPSNADHHTLGVMNHIALGVPDIKAAREQLVKNGWTGTEQPKIGRDGKWQLNLYDPDDARIEFMEFLPTQKPCCSEYTGPHPGQKP